MANNLISDVMKMATPAVVDRIAAAFGINADVVRNVLASAVPAVFAGLANQASSPGSLNTIHDAVRQADPNLSTSLSGPLAGGANNPMVASGSSMLNSVLGGGVVNTIVNAVTKNTGVSATAGTSLVAIAGQMAMAALARQAGSLDAAGLGNLLSSQASLFQSSLPASLASALGGSGKMASAPAAAAATTAARDAGRSATASTTSAANKVSAAARGGSNWLMWLIPIIIIAAALWYFLGHRATPVTTEATPPAQTTTTTTATPPAATTPAPATTTTTTATPPAATAPAATTTTTNATPPAATSPAAGAVMVDNVDVKKTLGDSISGLTAALSGVTDAASAQAAVSKVQDAAKGVSTVSGLSAKFTPEQKSTVAATVTSALSGLKEQVTKVEAMAGVGNVLKPAIDPVVAQLEALAKT